MVDRIKAVQDRLGRPLILENPSSYLEFRASSMPEWEFLARMAQDADCGLLLDVNNVCVTRLQPGLRPGRLYRRHARRADRAGASGRSQRFRHHLMDTHDAPVLDAVWPLYAQVQAATGGVSDPAGMGRQHPRLRKTCWPSWPRPGRGGATAGRPPSSAPAVEQVRAHG